MLTNTEKQAIAQRNLDTLNSMDDLEIGYDSLVFHHENDKSATPCVHTFYEEYDPSQDKHILNPRNIAIKPKNL